MGHRGAQRCWRRLRLQVEGTKLTAGVTEGRGRRPAGARVQLQDPVLRRLAFGFVGALPGRHRLRADAFLARKLRESRVGDARHHLVGDQVVRELGQVPGSKRLREDRRDAEHDLRDLLALRRLERRGLAAALARVEGLAPAPVEVMDHVPDGVRVGEHDLCHLWPRQPLRRQKHHLSTPPRDDRAAAATHQPEQPGRLLIADDLPKFHPSNLCPHPYVFTLTTSGREHHSGATAEVRSIVTGDRYWLLH